MMKMYSNRAFYALAAILLLSLGSIVSGCKDTAPDPGYVDFASARVMYFGKCTPMQIFYYPVGSKDTILLTPTPLTFGVSTPYVTNFPTGRGAGQTYHFIAKQAGTQNVFAETDITMKPGDKQSWIVFDKGASATYPHKVISDNAPAGTSNQNAYFRFLNSSEDNPSLMIRVGDPINGSILADVTPYKELSPYTPIPTSPDTTVTFFITDPSGTILGRLAGVSLSGGSFHTISWGGQSDSCRQVDEISGNRVLDDSIRVHLYDDNDAGNDQLPVPLTFRYNIINALIPPSFPNANLIDYRSTGLALIINNNTSYDYSGLQPFTTAPSAHSITADGVLEVFPRAIPLTGVVYVKAVSPLGTGPSVADPILFRFYAGPTSQIKSDQMMSVVIFDSVQDFKKELTLAPPYDSSKGVLTIPIPDQSIKGKAIVVVGDMMAGPYKTVVPKPEFYINGGAISTKIKKVKDYDVTTVVDAGSSVTVKAVLTAGSNIVTVNSTPFNAVDGAIYEVFLVGRFNDPRPEFQPKFIVIRTNPIK